MSNNKIIKDQRDFDSILCFGVHYDELNVTEMEHLYQKKAYLDEKFDDIGVMLGLSGLSVKDIKEVWDAFPDKKSY